LLVHSGFLILVGPGWHEVTDQWRWGVALWLITALFYAAFMVILRRPHTVRRLPETPALD
jgi:hypothetical protein